MAADRNSSTNYPSCPGVGKPVSHVTAAGTTAKPGWDGTGICAECGRDISQRGGVAMRHRAPKEDAMKHAPFAVGQKVRKPVIWRHEPIVGRITAVDNSAPLGLCYAVEERPGVVWHFSSLHMTAVD